MNGAVQSQTHRFSRGEGGTSYLDKLPKLITVSVDAHATASAQPRKTAKTSETPNLRNLQSNNDTLRIQQPKTTQGPHWQPPSPSEASLGTSDLHGEAWERQIRHLGRRVILSRS